MRDRFDRQASCAAHALEEEGVSKPLAGFRILIVDDESCVRRVLERVLQRGGAEVVQAALAADAFAVLGTFRPDLLISDINMPRMNGIELLRNIRKSPELRDSIVFMLTTSNDEQDKIDAYNLNVAGYMLKSDMGTSFTRAISLIDNYWKVVEFPVRATA